MVWWCVILQNLHKGLSLKGVVILADIRKTIGPLPQSICYPSGDPAVLCKGSSAFLIVDLTFHGQWRLFQVPCQQRSSGSFACLGRHLKICKLQRCRCLRFRWQVHICNKCISSSVMNRRQKRKVLSKVDAAWFFGRYTQISHSPCNAPRDIASVCESFVHWTHWNRKIAFPQQFRVSSVMISMFWRARSPRATWRGTVAMSDMSRKNCDQMEFTWDICPFIRKSSKPRQRCRRRCSKTCLEKNLLVCSVNAWAFDIGSLGGLSLKSSCEYD